MITAPVAPTDRSAPGFVFVPLDASPDRPAGMLCDRERRALHRAWIAAYDAGVMSATKAALLDARVPGWRSDEARAYFAGAR